MRGHGDGPAPTVLAKSRPVTNPSTGRDAYRMREPTIPVNELSTSGSGQLINRVKAWRRSASDLQRSRESNFVPASLINDPEHWRKRADEARNLADDMKDEISKQMMLQIAAEYGHLARRARARRWRSRFPASSVR